MAHHYRSGSIPLAAYSTVSAWLLKLYQHRYNAREENRACGEQDASHARDQFALLLLRFGFGCDIGR
jgi:hypothetical protein